MSYEETAQHGLYPTSSEEVQYATIFNINGLMCKEIRRHENTPICLRLFDFSCLFKKK